MKKLIVGMMFLASAASVFAQTANNAAEWACEPGAARANVTGTTDGDRFIRTTFTANCSTNTVMQVRDDAQKAWAAAASFKGQSIFGGSTNGGSIANIGPCNQGKVCGSVADTKTVVSGAAGMDIAATLGNTN